MMYFLLALAFFSLFSLPWPFVVVVLGALAFASPLAALSLGVFADILSYTPHASYLNVPWGVIVGILFFFVGHVARRFFAARFLFA